MKNPKVEYTNRLICLTFAMIFVAGAVGLGTVWMRHLIAEAASETRQMENRLAEVDRSLARINSEIASSLNPSFLQHQMRRFDLELKRPEEEQIVRLGKPRDLDYFADRSDSNGSDSSGALVYRRDSGSSHR